MNAAMDSLLIFTITGCLESDVWINEALQKPQILALSGFSLPHFGQFISSSLRL
jgi:hypothetical protein